MKTFNTILSLIFTLFFTTTISAQIFSDDFGTTGGGTSSTSAVLTNQCFDGDMGDYFGVVLETEIDQAFVGTDGAFLAGQDMDGTPCTAGSGAVDWTGINVAGETGLVLCLDIAEGDDGVNQDWDNTSTVTITVSVDGTTEILGVIESNDGATSNTFPAFDCTGDGDGDGTEITNTFSTFCFSIAVTGSALDINIAINGLDAGDEDIAIDNVEIYSDANPTATALNQACGGVPGCTDAAACNFDALATIDNGTCYQVGDTCDDGDAATNNDVYTNCATCVGQNTGVIDCGVIAWEVISPLPNPNASNNNGEWTATANGFSANGFCGGGCAEPVNSWIVYGPLDLTNTSTLNLLFDATEGFGVTDLNVAYTVDYSSACPSTATWTTVGTVTDAGAIDVDLSGATGTAVYIGIEYDDDGVDGYSNWDLTNFQLLGDVCPAVGTAIVSDCNVAAGCTDTNACNFDMTATIDDGTCFSVGDACDDANAMTTGDVYTDCATCVGTTIVAGNCPASAKINEFHYDNAGGDLNEFVEIALPVGADPTQIQVDLYNGGNGLSYNNIILSSTEFVSTDGTLDYYVWNVVPQNGNDGIAVSCIDGTQFQFITYEGAFMAVDGPFAGVMGIDVGVEETSATTETQSIMCDGTGNFLANCTADAGVANDLTTCGSVAGCTDANACNFDMNATSDDGSCFNINDACDDGNANTTNDVYVDCTTCAGTCPLGNAGDPCDDGDANTQNDTVTADCACAGTPIGGGTCPASAKINEFHYDNAGGDVNEFVEIALPAGSDPTGVQVDLYNGSNGASYSTIVLSSAEFVSTDGTFDYYVWSVSPQNGPDGIAVSCTDGTQYQFITYEGAFMATDGPFANVMGTDVIVSEPGDALETNSIMCDGTGTFLTNCTADAGAANDLTTCVAEVTGCTDVDACNYDATATADDGTCFNVGDACDDGDANTSGDVYVDCATCQGSTVPVAGCTDVNACNYDAAATVDDGTCFSTGDACDDGDANTNNDVYVDCATCAGAAPVTCPTSAKINEFHYDNAGGDVNEFVEIALPAGSDPTGVQVDLYNGSNGASYSTIVLSSTEFVSTDGTFDYYVWSVSPQNGPDGIAVSCTDGTQYQFITYEGAFMATDGPFANVMGTDVIVSEPGDALETNSIMCDGTGTFLTNCTADAGAANDLTTCVADQPECSLQSGTCANCPAESTNQTIDLTTGTSFNDGAELCAAFDCFNPVNPFPSYDAAANTGSWTLNAGYVNAFAVGGVQDIPLPDGIVGGCLTADLNIISGTTPFTIEFRIENGTGAPGDGGQALTFDVQVDGTGACSMGGDFSNGNAVNGFTFTPGTLYSIVIGVVDFTGAPVATDIVVEISNVALNVCVADAVVCNPPAGETCDDGDPNTINDIIQPDCSCAGETPSTAGCLDATASNFDPNADTDNGSCLYLCNESNLLDISTFGPFDGGTGLSYGAPTGMGLLAGASNDFGGFTWDVNTAGLTLDQICLFIDMEVIGDAAAFPINLEFRIQNECGGFPCPWVDFNITVAGPGIYTLGGLLADGNVSTAGVFDPNGPNTQIVAALPNFSGTALAANVDVVFSNLCVSDGNCVVEPVLGCTDVNACNYDPAATQDDGSCQAAPVCNTDICLGDTEMVDPANPCDCIVDQIQVLGCTNINACNYEANANCDDGSCDLGNTACPDACNEPDPNDNCDITTDTFDEATCTVSNTPNCAAGTTFNASTCNCDVNPILGCIDMDACNFDMNANTDDGSCVYAEASEISTTSSTTVCIDDGIDEPIDVTIDVAGQGDSGAWLITDQNAIILDLPAGPPFILDGAGVGTCLIWFVTFSDDSFNLQVGDNAADLVAASGCAALSNSISVIRDECGECAPNSGTFPWNGQ